MILEKEHERMKWVTGKGKAWEQAELQSSECTNDMYEIVKERLE